MDYLSASNLSDVNGTEDALSSPEPNWSDTHSPSLSDAVYFSNSIDIVCSSNGESDKPPPPKKKLINFFKLAKTRTSAFPNDLCWYKQQPGRAKKQQAADEHFSNCRHLRVFINMILIASICCSNDEFKGCRFIEKRP